MGLSCGHTSYQSNVVVLCIVCYSDLGRPTVITSYIFKWSFLLTLKPDTLRALGYQPPLKNTILLFLTKPPLNLQTVQVPPF